MYSCIYITEIQHVSLCKTRDVLCTVLRKSQKYKCKEFMVILDHITNRICVQTIYITLNVIVERRTFVVSQTSDEYRYHTQTQTRSTGDKYCEQLKFVCTHMND